jgi:hypothetical protein
MATKKKSFDAVAASRRWRIQAGKRLAAMTPQERREYLQRTTEAFFAAKADALVAVKPSRRVSAHR